MGIAPGNHTIERYYLYGRWNYLIVEGLIKNPMKEGYLGGHYKAAGYDPRTRSVVWYNIELEKDKGQWTEITQKEALERCDHIGKGIF